MKYKERGTRRDYHLSHLDPDLLRKIRLLAFGKDIPIYQVVDFLIRKGLAAEGSSDMSTPSGIPDYDVLIIPRKNNVSKKPSD